MDTPLPYIMGKVSTDRCIYYPMHLYAVTPYGMLNTYPEPGKESYILYNTEFRIPLREEYCLFIFRGCFSEEKCSFSG
jgi:hypothetical protein